MKKSILPVLIMFSVSFYCQFIDGNKDVIFQLDKAESSQIKFNGNELSFENNFQLKETVFTVKEKTSAVKSNILGIKFGLNNENKILDLSKISDFGFNIEASLKWTLKDSIYSSKSVFTGSIGVKYQMDRFKLYDPLISEIKEKTPSQVSLIGNMTRFFKNYKFAVTLNGAYNLYSYNKNELLNFKENSGLTQDINVVAFKDVDGKYGTISNDNNGGRLSFSVPFFFEKRILNLERMPYVILVPYFSSRFKNGSRPSQNTGLSMNFLQKRAFADKKFELPSSLGLGLDWGYKNGSWSGMNIFLSGSITLN